MNPLPRHQCFVYEGAPSVYLTSVARVLCEKLAENWRCLYLNSPSMSEGMRTCLAAHGVDVELATRRGSLVFSSERRQLVHGHFDVETMIKSLADALEQALHDGYAGLFATGDMTWEFGSGADFAQLVEYEWQVEDFLRAHSEISAICQYHADTLPAEVLRHGLATHPEIFINETLSLINPRFAHPRFGAGQSNDPPSAPAA